MDRTNVTICFTSAGAAAWWHRGAGGICVGVHALTGKEGSGTHPVRRDGEVSGNCEIHVGLHR